MAYQVDKFNGTFLISVADGTIDTTTDLRLVGKNYAGYGELQNENFVHLLENFANTTPPPKAIVGQIWYDSSTKKLRFYDGTRFKVSTGAEVAALAPTGLSIGEFWWDTSSKQLYCWSGTDYELIGPEASPELGQTAVIADVVRDRPEDPETPVQTHSIIKFLVGGKVVAIMSKTAFELSRADAITGFPKVKQGYTLVTTDGNGESHRPQDPDDPDKTVEGYIHWGTASNANKLGGHSWDDYILKSNVEFEPSVHFQNGYTLGGTRNDCNLEVFPNGEDTVIASRKGDNITIRMITRPSLNEYENVAVFTKHGVYPGKTATFDPEPAGYDLGAHNLRWKSIYANEIDVDSIAGNIKGDTRGTHYGNVLQWTPPADGEGLGTSDGTILVDAEHNTIGTPAPRLEPIKIYGTLFGQVIGGLTGTATNADKLGNLLGEIFTPTSVDKSSVVLRAADGAVYATRFVGVTDSANKLKIDDAVVDAGWNASDPATLYRSAKTTKTPYSIAARDANSSISANIFHGTATAARFADLAEKYLTDAEYEVGTVISVGGRAEVTASTFGDRAIGVVSENPAFMMNSELEGGTYIALKGRVPVKVMGPVLKGQHLVADNNGYATVSLNKFEIAFAIALESNTANGKKIIEAIIL